MMAFQNTLTLPFSLLLDTQQFFAIKKATPHNTHPIQSESRDQDTFLKNKRLEFFQRCAHQIRVNTQTGSYAIHQNIFEMFPGCTTLCCAISLIRSISVFRVEHESWDTSYFLSVQKPREGFFVDQSQGCYGWPF